MAKVHGQFLKIPSATDVMTFEHGEILIGADTARENAARFRQSVERELCLYIIHGLLHLSGHDDQQPRDAERMRRAQTRVLQMILPVSAA